MYKLTDSGLLTSSNNDIILSDLTKRFKNSDYSNKSIIYKRENGEISIITDYDERYTIALTEEQKYKYENGISDKHLNRIKDLIDFNDDRIFILKTIEDAEEGKLPTTPGGINVYSFYLDAEIVKSGAEIAKQFVVSCWPILLIVGSIPLWKMVEYAMNIDDVIFFLASLGVACLMDLSGLIAGYLKTVESIEDRDFEFFSTAKIELEEIRINLLKKQDLRNWKRNLEKTQTPETTTADINSFIAKEKKKETDEAIENNDETLGEIKEIIELIKQLPEEERDKYSERIIEIIKDYQEKISKIISNDRSLPFGLAGDVHSLRIELTPSLTNIRYEVEEILYREKKLREVKQECESIISSVGESEYDGWSDDLTKGNMATMS